MRSWWKLFKKQANESALTGESAPLKKSKLRDPFLLSSCTISDADQVRMTVIGIGSTSQWGRIRATLVEEPDQTPLQVKLESVAKSIGYLGAVAAAATFAVIFIYIFVHSEPILAGTVQAFVLAVTIVVVAIPGTCCKKVCSSFCILTYSLGTRGFTLGCDYRACILHAQDVQRSEFGARASGLRDHGQCN